MTIDVDVLDPAFAPGMGTPEPGGMTSEDLPWAARMLADITALVGSRIVHELLTGIALRRTATAARASRHTAAGDPVQVP